jgi:hypothetical protein
MKEITLNTDIGKYLLKLEDINSTAQRILSQLPILGEAKNIGGEIFYIIDIDIPFDGSEKEVFEVGDIVYWRSQKEKKYAIAIFYGNTKFGDGTKPRAASSCMKFASIIENCSALENVSTGSDIKIS